MSTVALVSGASRGIGAAIARSLAQRAYHVIVNYHRNADAAKQVVADIEAAGSHNGRFTAEFSSPRTSAPRYRCSPTAASARSLAR